MAQQSAFSVVIPAHNAEATIDRCLDAFECQTVSRESFEVIVVDDGSSDDTPVRVKSRVGVRLLSQDHAGPAAARNLGVRRSRGEIVLFTDADCEPLPDWIEHMTAPFDDDRVVGAKGAYLSRQQSVVARFVQIEYEEKYDRLASVDYIDFVDTYAAGYRKAVFMAAGGFDASFVEASVEDQELSFRLADGGHKMAFVPEARVYHWGHPSSPRAYWRRKFKIGYWKAKLATGHPGRLFRDSHTPQTLRVQILLAMLGGASLLGGFLWSPLWLVLVFSSILFLFSSLPFVLRAWKKDRLVSLLAPILLLVRALALATGFALGLVAHLGRKRQS